MDYTNIRLALGLIIVGIVAIALLILLLRFIGWALGLSDIRRRSEAIIDQNNQILDALDTLTGPRPTPEEPSQDQ